MRPYPRSHKLNTSKKIFNYRLSRARRTVECAFGILVARWRLYRRPIIASISIVVKAVQATIVLHNFIINEELHLSEQERKYGRIDTHNALNTSGGLTAVNDNNKSRNLAAIKIRNDFAHYFEYISPLSWQWDKVLSNDF